MPSIVIAIARSAGSFSTSKSVAVVRTFPMSKKLAAVTWPAVSITDVRTGDAISDGMMSVRVASNASVGLEASCLITMV